jgi:multidrug efflux pump subunit AcrA (membrane-fusion protein)
MKYFLVGMALLLASCGAGSKNNTAEKESVETLFAVSVIPAASGQIQDYLETNGEVVSKISVDVFTDNNGKITRFTKSLGDSVAVNEVIGYVDPSRPGNQFALSPIRSPIAGTVTSLPYKVGSTVTMQSSVAKVSRLDQLEIVTYVAERFYSKVKLGQKAYVKFDAFPGVLFEGVVFEISPFIDSNKRTLELKINLTRADQSRMIEMGMFAEIRLVTAFKENVVKIPNSAIIRRSGVPYVFVVRGENSLTAQNEIAQDNANEQTQNEAPVRIASRNWVEQVEIHEGISIDGQVEILSGIKAGELVVIRGQNSLGNNSGIRVVEELPPMSGGSSLETSF